MIRAAPTTTTTSRKAAAGDEETGDASVSSESSPTTPAVAVTVERVLQDNYPEFYALLSQNENIFQTLEDDFSDNGGYTIFAPNAQAFAELTDKQKLQLKDPRNMETIQKMGLYHVVSEQALSMTQLNREDWTVPKTPEGLPALKFSAIVTMGGEVPLGRFKKKMDNRSLWRTLLDRPNKTIRDKEGKPVTEIVVGPSGTIVQSVRIGNAIIHEVDGFVSPLLLWRYMDQLRMPGL